jgi:hypothetical protein
LCQLDRCIGDTLTFNGFYTSTHDLPRPGLARSVNLKIWPNPVSRGEYITVEPMTGESPDIIQEAIWYDMSGQVVHREFRISPYGVLSPIVCKFLRAFLPECII